MDGASNSGPYDPSSIPLGEKNKNKRKRVRGLPIIKEVSTYVIYWKASDTLMYQLEHTAFVSL